MRTDDANPACHDSFLDVVTNIVGILIVFVVVAGLRAKNAPVQTSMLEAAPTQEARAELEKELAAEQGMRRDMLDLAEQIRAVQRTGLARFLERDQLATLASLMEHKIEDARKKLDANRREDFDLARSLSEARLQWDQIDRQRRQVEQSEAAPTVVEVLPTPLAKRVDSDETHFQLRGGRVAYIPLDKLLERFHADARQHIHKLLQLNEITETVGPEGGFRLRYTIERRDVSIESQLKTGRGAYAQLRQWTLIPTSDQLGEPLSAALADTSSFRQTLAALKPGKTTVTLWVYEDSFAEFRELRKELHRLGFATAARPLPADMPIGGAPDGSKSAAE